MIAIFSVQVIFVAAALAWLAAERPPSKAWALVYISAVALVLTGAILVGIWLYPPLWAAALLAGSVFVAIAIGVVRRAGVPVRMGVCSVSCKGPACWRGPAWAACLCGAA